MPTITMKLPENGHMLWEKNNELIRTWDTSGSTVSIGIVATDGYVFLAPSSGGTTENPYFIAPDGTIERAIGYGTSKTNYEGKTVYETGRIYLYGKYQVESFTELNIIGALTHTLEKPETKKITILNNINNSTVSPTEVELGKETTITITASDNYHFSTAPIVKTNDTELTTTLDSTNKTATITTTFSDSTTEIQINGTTEEDPKTITITNNITNATIDPTSVILGKETTIKISVAENYSFETAPTVKINDSTVLNTVLSEDNKSATITNTFDNDTTTISIEGSVIKDIIKLPITFGEYENCTINPTEITLGSKNTLVLTADDDATFETQPYLTSSDGTRLIFELSDDNKTGTLKKYFGESETKITLYATAVKPVITDYNPFVAIFVPTLSQLKTLGNIAQINPTSGSDLNLAQYIYGLYKVFIDVPTENEEKNILLGKYDTQIKSSICNKEIVHLYTSSYWSLPGRDRRYPAYNNPAHRKFKMFLPFVGVVDISDEANSIISTVGSTRVHYICNLLSMKCTVLLENSGTGIESAYFPIQNWEGEFGYNYPFVQGKEFSRIDFNSENVFNLENTTIRMYSIEDQPYENGNNKIGYPIPHYVNSLSELINKGYFELSHVKMPENSQITDTEKEELIRLLSDGVYF